MSIPNLVFVVVVTNAGGEGKTTITKLLQGAMLAGGTPVQVIDADAGNRAAKLSDPTALAVNWDTDESKALDIVDRTRSMNVILDIGANTFASGNRIVELIAELVPAYAEAGYRTVALLPVSTNKIAAVEAVARLDEKLPRWLGPIEKYFVRVNRDGSSAFGGKLDETRAVDLQYLQPGFQEFLHHLGCTWDSAILNPPPGYERAADYVARWMCDFIRQPIIGGLLDGTVLSDIEYFRPNMPDDRLLVIPARVADTGNVALRQFEQQSQIVRLLGHHGWHADGLRAAADYLELRS